MSRRVLLLISVKTMVAYRAEMEGQSPNPALDAKLFFGCFQREYLPGALTPRKHPGLWLLPESLGCC